MSTGNPRINFPVCFERDSGHCVWEFAGIRIGNFLLSSMLTEFDAGALLIYSDYCWDS